jgi:hypothetical protein
MMNRSRPIIHDSSYPISGSRDRRRLALDNDPTVARPALQAHLRSSMSADNYAKAIDLLNAYADSLLGLGGGERESDPSAMDARFDSRPGMLAGLFPASSNPRLAPHAGAVDLSAPDNRVLDHRPGVLSELFPDSANPSARIR